MSTGRLFTYASAGLLALFAAAPRPVLADQWNQKTVFTFNQPVEIPGQVLPPGTYVFKLVDFRSDRNVVQIFDQKETHLYGTVLAIPDYHLKARGKVILTFEERAAGAPEAIKAWFWPGENFGHEFVYPKTKAVELAKTNQMTVPSMSNEVSTTNTTTDNNAITQTPLAAQQPNEQETDIATAFPPQDNQVAEATPPPAPAPATPRPAPAESLPRTGSSLPLIGLLGVLSLALAGSLRIAASKVS